MNGWVYIMTNRANGVLYLGSTTDLIHRVWEHREGSVTGFTHKYEIKNLIYFEQHETVVLARQRERNMKHWSRAWKIRLILDFNPSWTDLYETIAK